jgi:hypothetical protein
LRAEVCGEAKRRSGARRGGGPGHDEARRSRAGLGVTEEPRTGHGKAEVRAQARRGEASAGKAHCNRGAGT